MACHEIKKYHIAISCMCSGEAYTKTQADFRGHGKESVRNLYIVCSADASELGQARANTGVFR